MDPEADGGPTSGLPVIRPDGDTMPGNASMSPHHTIAHYRIVGKIMLDEADLGAYVKSCRVEAGGKPLSREVSRSPRVFPSRPIPRASRA